MSCLNSNIEHVLRNKTELGRTSLTLENSNLPSQNYGEGDRGRTYFMVHVKAANYTLHQKLYFGGYLILSKWIMTDFSLSLNCYMIKLSTTTLTLPKRVCNQIFWVFFFIKLLRINCFVQTI